MTIQKLSYTITSPNIANGENTLDKLYDGNYDTGFREARINVAIEFYLDLGAVKKINSLNTTNWVTENGIWRADSLEFYTSDNAVDYTLQKTVKIPKETTPFSIDLNFKTRFLKIVIPQRKDGMSIGNGLKEIELYGVGESRFLLSATKKVYTIKENVLEVLDEIVSDELFKEHGITELKREHLILIGQQLGKAKIIKMEI